MKYFYYKIKRQVENHVFKQIKAYFYNNRKKIKDCNKYQKEMIIKIMNKNKKVRNHYQKFKLILIQKIRKTKFKMKKILS